MSIQSLLALSIERLCCAQDNQLVRWCPSVPHCGRALRVAGEVHCEPECACGQRFCFACALEPHSPCTCDMCAPPSHRDEPLAVTSHCMSISIRGVALSPLPGYPAKQGFRVRDEGFVW